MSSSELLEVRGLDVAWGSTPVVTDVNLELHEGELLVLMGPNGSGKTTLLRALVGLEAPIRGSVRLRGRPLDGVPPHRRGIGMLFQEPALFPHRSVWENVAYGLEVAGAPRAEVDRRVEEMLPLLRLGPLAERRPEALSGGERQRVALARTLAPRPALVLLDEPFASVDPELRRDLRSEFGRALRSTATGAIHVTHDREEGMLLADRVALLLGGRLRAPVPPEEVFRSPGDVEAARFLGYNVVREGNGWVAVAPSEIRISARDDGGRPGHVTASAFSGRDQVVEVELDGGEELEARLPLGAARPGVGAAVRVRWDSSIPVNGPAEGTG